MNTNPDGSLDFEPVTIEEAVASVETPAEHAKRMEEASKKYDLPKDVNSYAEEDKTQGLRTEFTKHHSEQELVEDAIIENIFRENLKSEGVVLSKEDLDSIIWMSEANTNIEVAHSRDGISGIFTNKDGTRFIISDDRAIVVNPDGNSQIINSHEGVENVINMIDEDILPKKIIESNGYIRTTQGDFYLSKEGDIYHGKYSESNVTKMTDDQKNEFLSRFPLKLVSVYGKAIREVLGDN